MTKNYRVVFYENSTGEIPFEVFLDGHTEKVRNKFLWLLRLLEMNGPDLKRPHADMLRDGIRELRGRVFRDSYRALFYFMIGKIIVITHAFIKKTDEVPQQEIERALRYKRDFEERIQRGEYRL